jgi:3'(2'), 5'-bisphosphate nucleotidase
MMAEGLADIYPRLSPTSEWDIGAGDAILREVGKMVYQYSDEVEPTDYLEKNKREKLTPLQYDKKDLINPNFVVVDI